MWTGPLFGEEQVGCGDEGDVAVSADERAAFEVVEPQGDFSSRRSCSMRHSNFARRARSRAGMSAGRLGIQCLSGSS